MKYREERNARVLEALTTQLGEAFQPLPQSNRQFEALTTTMSRLGADRVGRVWALALEIDKGKPAAILAAMQTASELATVEAPKQAASTLATVEKTVETTPETVEMADGQLALPPDCLGKTVEKAEQTVESVEKTVEKPMVHVVVPVSALTVRQVPPMLKLESALAVVRGWSAVKSWVKSVEDPKEKLVAHRLLKELATALRDFGYENEPLDLQELVHRVGGAIRLMEEPPVEKTVEKATHTVESHDRPAESTPSSILETVEKAEQTVESVEKTVEAEAETVENTASTLATVETHVDNMPAEELAKVTAPRAPASTVVTPKSKWVDTSPAARKAQAEAQAAGINPEEF